MADSPKSRVLLLLLLLLLLCMLSVAIATECRLLLAAVAVLTSTHQPHVRCVWEYLNWLCNCRPFHVYSTWNIVSSFLSVCSFDSISFSFNNFPSLFYRFLVNDLASNELSITGLFLLRNLLSPYTDNYIDKVALFLFQFECILVLVRRRQRRQNKKWKTDTKGILINDLRPMANYHIHKMINISIKSHYVHLLKMSLRYCVWCAPLNSLAIKTEWVK